MGSLKNEKLKNKKITNGTKMIIKNLWKFWLGIRKYKIASVEIDTKLNVPSIPSK